MRVDLTFQRKFSQSRSLLPLPQLHPTFFCLFLFRLHFQQAKQKFILYSTFIGSQRLYCSNITLMLYTPCILSVSVPITSPFFSLPQFASPAQGYSFFLFQISAMAPKRKKPPQASLNRRNADTPGISNWLNVFCICDLFHRGSGGGSGRLDPAERSRQSHSHVKILLPGPSRETAAIASGADLSKAPSTAAAKKWAGILPKSGHGKRRDDV